MISSLSRQRRGSSSSYRPATTINPGTEKLMMANLVSAGFASEYTFYEQMQGGAYYLMEEGGWVRNSRYPTVPPMSVIPAGEVPEPGIGHGRGIYGMVSGREKLSYLNLQRRSRTASLEHSSTGSFVLACRGWSRCGHARNCTAAFIALQFLIFFPFQDPIPLSEVYRAQFRTTRLKNL